jgi:hypothetical protein
MTIEEIKKKVLEMYELLELDIDDLTEEEISRIVYYYHKNIDRLKQDLLNIKNKKEGGSKE